MRSGRGLLVLATLALVGCGSRPERVDVVPVYRLSVTPAAVAWLGSEQTVAVTMEDARKEDPSLIGTNTEEAKPVPIHETPAGSVKALVGSSLKKELTELGAKVVEPGSADRTLQVELIKFWIEEDNTYNGDVRARVTVVDKDGASLASVLATGNSKRFGRSLSVENYQETIENMLQDMMGNLFQNADFQQAFSASSEGPATVPEELPEAPPGG
jgi:uncharacterized lipoprotein YajG